MRVAEIAKSRATNILCGAIIGATLVLIMMRRDCGPSDKYKPYKYKPPTAEDPGSNNIESIGAPKVLEQNSTEAMRRLIEANVSQTDPRLIQLIRDFYILPPSSHDYSLNNPLAKDFAGQGKENLPKLLTDIPKKGFFIECGANDGEFLSTSLYFEKTLQWNGLLIEANPKLFHQLRTKNRKAYALNACLSTKPYPTIMKFNMYGAYSRLVDDTFEQAYKLHGGPTLIKKSIIEIQCFPLYSVLLAIGQTHIDFFSLDVEGSELAILKTIPWEKVNITHLLVEFSHDEGRLPAVKNYLESSGYSSIKVFQEDILVKKKT